MSKLHVQSTTIPMAPPCQDTNAVFNTAGEEEKQNTETWQEFQKEAEIQTHHFSYCLKV